MLKEILHYSLFAPWTIAMRWSMDHARFREIITAREDRAGMEEKRRALVRGLRGRVLEVGCGTGPLFRHYPAGAEVTAIEPDSALRERARRTAELANAQIRVIPGRGEVLPFESNSFDAVVSCFVLCSVDEVDQVLCESRRVLKTRGTLHLMEHVRSERAIAGRVMDLLNPIWKLLHRTRCNLNRRVTKELLTAGFHARQETRFNLFCRGVASLPMTIIRARAHTDTALKSILHRAAR